MASLTRGRDWSFGTYYPSKSQYTPMVVATVSTGLGKPTWHTLHCYLAYI